MIASNNLVSCQMWIDKSSEIGDFFLSNPTKENWSLVWSFLDPFLGTWGRRSLSMFTWWWRHLFWSKQNVIIRFSLLKHLRQYLFAFRAKKLVITETLRSLYYTAKSKHNDGFFTLLFHFSFLSVLPLNYQASCLQWLKSNYSSISFEN